MNNPYSERELEIINDLEEIVATADQKFEDLKLKEFRNVECKNDW